MTYVSEALSRNQLRCLATQIRKTVGFETELYFPVIPFLEIAMPTLFPKFYYEIVPKEFFSEKKHADTDILNHCVRIREDIYYGATKENGRDRMTIAHKIAHYILLVVCGVKFNRSFDSSKAIYCDPKWQAKALAGELMCQAHLIQEMTTEMMTGSRI